MPNILAKAIDFTTVKSIPFASIFYGIGLNYIITLICFTISLLRKNRNLIAYLPFLGLWLTMMIAAPVYAEMRYAYGLFVCMPLIVLIPFMSKGATSKN